MNAKEPDFVKCLDALKWQMDRMDIPSQYECHVVDVNGDEHIVSRHIILTHEQARLYGREKLPAVEIVCGEKAIILECVDLMGNHG